MKIKYKIKKKYLLQLDSHNLFGLQLDNNYCANINLQMAICHYHKHYLL